MLKNEYLQEIIGNLGIAISSENNSEIIIKFDIFLDKKNNNYVLSDEYKIFYQELGTIIVDFLNTNFINKSEFVDFFNKYGLFGLENRKINALFANNSCPIEDFDAFIEKSIRKYTKTLISYQKEINSILSYCIFNPNKHTKTLTPFERLCMLEYLPDNSALLQENIMQTITLNTLSNIHTPSVSEEELVKLIQNQEVQAYSNIVSIPSNIESLLHFELSEIIKNNIILKICKYCNRYFITTHKKTDYCNNIAPGYTTKTCKQIAKNKVYLENIKQDDALTLFTKVYNNKAYKASRYSDINNYKIDYEHFKKIGSKKVKSYKANKISKDDFIDWINRNK